jgi:CheY-like chemotaxis protein
MEQTRAPASPQNVLHRPRSHARRVLVVDDNVDSREMLQTFLEMRGHTVRTAPHGVEALIAATSFIPDVILLDLCLPGMDGREVCARLRETPATRKAVIFALTAATIDTRAHHEDRTGWFDAHLLKPVDLDVVDVLVSSVGLSLDT